MRPNSTVFPDLHLSASGTRGIDDPCRSATSFTEPGKGWNIQRCHLLWEDGSRRRKYAAITKRTILVVEDEALIRLAMTDMLEGAGFCVLEAKDAAEATKTLDECSEALTALVTDIRLGEGPDGWDVAQHARKQSDEIPIIFVSADSAAEWSERGIARSVMLAKPVPDNDLLAAIEDGMLGD